MVKTGPILRIDETSALPEGGLRNCIVHSKVRTYDKCNTVSSSLSIKSVLSGVERYRLNKVDYRLSTNEYLIVDEGQLLDIAFKEEQLAEGVCIYLDKDFFKQALSLMILGHSRVMDDPETMLDNELLSLKYRQTDSSFGSYLRSVSDVIREGNTDKLSEEFFVSLSWKLARHHQHVSGTVDRISAVKTGTRVELYRRAMLARDYIEGNLFSQNISIKQLALHSALSEVQLHRVFKKVFTAAPYQYVIKRKMDKAAELLEAKSMSVADLGRFLGFPDTPTFSKLFKKTFGVSPSLFQGQN